MASIAIMVGGALLNAAAFNGGNYLARSLSGDGKAAQEEKVGHDKALEAYQAAYAKHTRDRTKRLDWIAINAQIKEQAKQIFPNTTYAVQTLLTKPTQTSRCYLLKNPSSLIFNNPASTRNKAT